MAAIVTWRTAVDTCFKSRRRPSDCRSALTQLHRRNPISGLDLIRLVIDLADLDKSWHDPLLNLYLLTLLDDRLASTADILEAFSRHTDLDGQRRRISPIVLTSVLELLCRCFVQGAGPADIKDAGRAVTSLQTWLADCTAGDWTGISDASDHQHHRSYSPRDQLAVLAVNILDSQHVKRYLADRLDDTARQHFAHLVSTFVDQLSHDAGTSPTIAIALPRLTALVKAPPLFKVTRQSIKNMSSGDLVALVSEMPLSTSRAGLYVLVNALLVCPPMVDDQPIFSRLSVRYPQPNLQSLVLDLVVASFDVLSTRDNSEYIKSFIVNKLPLILLAFSNQMLYPPGSTEQLIRMALGRLDANTFAQASGGPDLRQTRNEFVAACYQHRMIPYAYAFEAMGAQPKAVFCQKDALVAACTGAEQIEKLVQSLDRLDGNAAQVAAALVQVVQQSCTAKDTSSLKSVALAMTKRLALMDFVFQYFPISAVLDPISDILNAWTHDDDQTEFQPAYEEYSAILLFVMALTHRYGLKPATGVLGRIMSSARSALPAEKLTDAQSKNMTMWVKGMFATDERGESSGISDDVLSQCSPLDFYLLVPTLFDQGLMACETKAMTVKTFLGGLEFFLEPFLLPAQVGVVLWISSQAWQHRNDTPTMLLVLNKLLRPASISGDAQTMHEAALTIIAGPLTTALARIKAAGKDVDELLALLKDRPKQQGLDMTLNEIRDLPSAGWSRLVRDIVTQLTGWSTQADLNPAPPPRYSHKAFLTAVKLAGPDQIVDALVDEVVQQTSLGLGPAALEVAAALCSAPVADTSMTGPVTLLQVLQDLTSDTKKMLQCEPAKFEATVRLQRLIEAAAAAQSVQSLPLQSTLEAAASVAAMPPLDVAAATDQSLVQDAMDLASATTAATADFPMSIDAAAAEIVAAAYADPTSAVPSAGDMQLGLADGLFGAAQPMDFSLDQLQTSVGADDMMMSAPSALTFGGDDDIFAGLELDPTGDDVDFGL